MSEPIDYVDRKVWLASGHVLTSEEHEVVVRALAAGADFDAMLALIRETLRMPPERLSEIAAKLREVGR